MERNQGEKSTLIRRLIDSGLSILESTTEDGERIAIHPLALPKEFINTVISQVDRGKSEVVALFGREFKRFLDATDLSEEVVKALKQMSIEVKAEISFKENGEPKATIQTRQTSKKTVRKKK